MVNISPLKSIVAPEGTLVGNYCYAAAIGRKKHEREDCDLPKQKAQLLAASLLEALLPKSPKNT